MGRFWHGGFPGLRPGQLLDGMHGARHLEGCELCRQRMEGKSVIDPLSAQRGRVYVTTDREYARFYASLAHHGDLYQVQPVGDLDVSQEDRFPTWTATSARVVAVYARAVTLTDSQRSALIKRWRELDMRADGKGHLYDAMSPADRRSSHRREMRRLWHSATQLAAVSKGRTSI